MDTAELLIEQIPVIFGPQKYRPPMPASTRAMTIE